MTFLVPEMVTAEESVEKVRILREVLSSARGFLGAPAAWISLHRSGGGLLSPIREGEVPTRWLEGQQSHCNVWGFAFGEAPTLLNDLPAWATRGDPPLHNLLVCSVQQGGESVGHIAVANKASGFAGTDAAVLQGMAYHIGRLLTPPPATRPTIEELPGAWRRILDRVADGVVILDDAGVLVYANRTWLDWTGFAAGELLGCQAPFPFWVGPHDLAQAPPPVPGSADALPFRRRDDSLFWCQIETLTEPWQGRSLTTAFLHRLTMPAPRPDGSPVLAVDNLNVSPSLGAPTPLWLPLLLEPGGSVEGWGPCWEKQTGLASDDIESSRTELVLDWLLPQQHDRDRVADCFHQSNPTGCQFLLDVTTAAGSRLMACTLLPLTPGESAARRRWLLLVGEPDLSGDPRGPQLPREREPTPG
jgi:PAS domain-containing protein